MMTQARIAIFALPVATVMTLIAPATGRAQGATPQGTATLTDSRWQPWLGCWTPVERAPRDRDIQVCIVPTADGGGARMLTFAGDQRILDDTILADGSTQTLNEVGCRGSSRSRWAKNAARLFRTTELTCDGKAPQRTSGISTLEESGRWLDVQVVVVGMGDQVRARHYVRSSETPPAEIADQVRRLPDGATRASSSVTADDVIEANAIVSHRAVEVWLSESNAQVPVNRRTLLALHGANVPAPVIDLMVARAYPKRFEVRRSGSGGSFGSFFDDIAWASPFDLLFDPYAFYYSPFGSYRQFVDPALYSIGGYVIVPAENNGVAQQSGNGRVVNGSGYTRVEPRQPAVVVGRTTGDSYDSGGSSSSGVSSPSSDGGSASPAGYSSGGGGGGGQTAVPR
jgi:hypothetical protein